MSQPEMTSTRASLMSEVFSTSLNIPPPAMIRATPATEPSEDPKDFFTSPPVMRLLQARTTPANRTPASMAMTG